MLAASKAPEFARARQFRTRNARTGICIALMLLGINLLGDALRDRLDPRMAQG